MKFRFTLIIILVCTYSLTIKAQSADHKYKALADKVFKLKIKPGDFQEGRIFLTLDTMNAHDFTAPSDYTEYTDPKPLIKKFKHFMRSCKWEGNYYNYHELIDHPLYSSPLHQSFLVNNETNTYKIDIWNSKHDITKIEGITVLKYEMKFENSEF